jgi:hypothetical protein
MLANDSVTVTVGSIWLTEFDIAELEESTASSLPRGGSPRVITGHTTLLNGAVHILDYKPDAHRQADCPTRNLALALTRLSRPEAFRHQVRVVQRARVLRNFSAHLVRAVSSSKARWSSNPPTFPPTARSRLSVSH